jgi:tetratricopeptide (TPR) repeat protein
MSETEAHLKHLGRWYLEAGNFVRARPVYKRLMDRGSRDIEVRFCHAQLIDDGTHARRAEARDMLLAILDENPGMREDASEPSLLVIRAAAQRCATVGPFDRAIELYRGLARLSGQAEDWFALSEILTQGNFLAESIASLERAIWINPAAYDTPANRETLETARTAKPARNKVGRYPDTTAFKGDLQALISGHIAVNLHHEPKFLNKGSRFFTMGSCFARNLSMSLIKGGYQSHHMEISEYVNTTFANRVFVDWLSGAAIPDDIRDRLLELLPPGWSRDNTLNVIRSSDVFILTLGVAAAFFDRTTGEFVLPRPSALNSRALAEKYRFRTATVRENVDNVLHLIAFVRSINPRIRIVVTVSPVPLLASFEFESAVQADCLSKCTMRLVAHEVVANSGIADILYWPSFEVFRWVASNASDYYAADDGAAWHVSEDKVAGTVRAFVEMFSAPEPGAVVLPLAT